jgi:uncharacterized protein YegP (UPF0339 family)
MADHYLEVYRDKGLLRRWRWRRKAGNHHIVEIPGQGFTRKSSAVRSARDAHPGDEIRVLS